MTVEATIDDSSYSSFAHNMISSHWAPSSLLLQITLAGYSEPSVTIYYFIVSLSELSVLISISYDSIRPKTKNSCSVAATQLEN